MKGEGGKRKPPFRYGKKDPLVQLSAPVTERLPTNSNLQQTYDQAVITTPGANDEVNLQHQLHPLISHT